MISVIINLSYIISAILFVLGIKMLGSPDTARRGNLISSVGMLIAVVVTLLNQKIISYQWIVVGLVVGSLIGTIVAKKVEMTSMPEMVAIFNGFGGLASLLVGWAEYQPIAKALEASKPVAGKLVNLPITTNIGTLVAVYLAVIIGGLTFSGSLIAYAKLSEKISGKPFLFAGQQIINSLLVIAVVAGGAFYAANLMPQYTYYIFIGAVVVSLLLGILAVMPIGGADMPVVISLMNSYSGIAACAAGFIILNNVLIVAGALVGASGIILTNIMCKAMNRSLSNVLFSGFGSGTPKSSSTGAGVQGEVKPITADDAYYILEAASSVVITPGYGMAVAQAQHAVRELASILEERGCEVKFAIHPVAGRMPGHMNVLLAEANVPYEQLAEPDDVNPTMENVDVCMVIGANDVVNPAAREDESSPIYGMPIIDVDKARTVFVLKRSMASGFAGVDNPLFFGDNTRMLFGDAKSTVSSLVAQFKE
ncbi:MAG: NAD(P) transhydrogenase subunit beta [bacterium]